MAKSKYNVGDASLRISPDVSGFKQKLETEMKGVKVEAFDIKVSPDLDHLLTELEAAVELIQEAVKINLKVRVDTGRAVEELAAFHELAEQLSIKQNVDVDHEAASARLAIWRREQEARVIRQRVVVEREGIGGGRGSGGSSGRDEDEKINFGSVQGFAGPMNLMNVAKLGAATSAVGSLASALLGLVAAAGAAGAALGALGGAAAIGMTGVIKAFTELKSKSDNAAQTAKTNADSQKAANKQLEAAVRGVATAQDAHKSALDGVKAAQDKLNQSWREGSRQLRDMNLELATAQEDQEGAAIALARAKGNRAKVMRQYRNGEASRLDVQEANLDVRKARTSLKSAQNRASDQKVDTAEANRKGISGTKAVVTAQDDMKNALKSLADANRGLADAKNTLADAQRGLQSALQGTQVDKFAEAMKKLAPNARDFVNQVRSLGSAWTSLRIDVQNNLFANLGETLTNVAGEQMPRLHQGFAQLATILNGALISTITKLSHSMTEMSRNGQWTAFVNSTRASMSNFGTVVDSLFRSLIKLGTAMGPQLGEFFGAFAKYVDDATPTFEKLGQDTLQEMTRFLPVLAQLFKNLGPIMTALLPIITNITAKLSELIGQNQGRLSSFGTQMQTVLPTALGIFAQALKEVLPLIQFLMKIFNLPGATGFFGTLLAGTMIFRALFNPLAAFANALFKVQTAFENLVNFGRWFKSGAGTMVSGFNSIRNAVATNVQVLKDYWNWTGKAKAASMWTSVKTSVAGAMASIRTAIVGAMQAAAASVRANVQAMKDFWTWNLKLRAQNAARAVADAWAAAATRIRASLAAMTLAVKRYTASAILNIRGLQVVITSSAAWQTMSRAASTAFAFIVARAKATALFLKRNALIMAGALGGAIALLSIFSGSASADTGDGSGKKDPGGFNAMYLLLGASLIPMIGKYIGATRLAAAATKAWSAVQTVFNLIMDANPIMLAVIAVAALVAGVIYAYKHFQGFRDVVAAIWDWIKKAAAAVWQFKEYLLILLGPIGYVILAGLKIVQNWDKIKDAATAVGKWIVDKFTWWIKFIIDTPAKLAAGGKKMFTWLKDAFKESLNWIIKKWNSFSLTLKLPKALGGKKFTISTPNLPTLATGGDIPAAGRTADNMLYGPGNSTSDDILAMDKATGAPVAWVSTDEGIVNGKAMQRWPWLFQAMNRGDSTLDHLPKFADGGAFQQLGKANWNNEWTVYFDKNAGGHDDDHRNKFLAENNEALYAYKHGNLPPDAGEVNPRSNEFAKLSGNYDALNEKWQRNENEKIAEAQKRVEEYKVDKGRRDEFNTAWKKWFDENANGNDNRDSYLARNPKVNERYRNGEYPPGDDRTLTKASDDEKSDDKGSGDNTGGGDNSSDRDQVDNSQKQADDGTENLANSITEEGFKARNGGTNTHQAIIVHTTEGDTAQGAIDQLRKDGNSYHIVIDENAKERRLLNDDEQAGAAMAHGNQVGLHVALTGRSGQKWSEGTLKTLGARMRAWSDKFGIPLKKIDASALRDGTKGIAGHADVSGAWHETDHTDPGGDFPWDNAIGKAKIAGNAADDNPDGSGTDSSKPTNTEATDRAVAFAKGESGKPYQYSGIGNPSWDCSGFMSGIYASFLGKDVHKRYFSTESDFESLKFVKGLSEGAFQIGVHRGGGGPNSHMAGTMPDGTKVESGGAHNSVAYGGQAAGADDSYFELKYSLLPTEWNPAGGPASDKNSEGDDDGDDPGDDGDYDDGDGSGSSKKKDEGIKASTKIADAKINGVFSPKRYFENAGLAQLDNAWDWALDAFDLKDSILSDDNVYWKQIKAANKENEELASKKKKKNTKTAGSGDESDETTRKLENTDTKSDSKVTNSGSDTYDANPNKAAVKRAFKPYGWNTGEQWTATDKLVQGESGWNPTARNSASGAFGLFQFLGSTKEAYLPSESTDPFVQGKAGAKYLKDRPDYGDPKTAFDLWMSRSPHWYADGGKVKGPGGPRDDAIPAKLSDGEFVVNAASAAIAEPLLSAINQGPAAAEAVANMVVPGGGAAIAQIAENVAGAAKVGVATIQKGGSKLANSALQGMSVREAGALAAAGHHTQVQAPQNQSRGNSSVSNDNSMVIGSVTTANVNDFADKLNQMAKQNQLARLNRPL